MIGVDSNVLVRFLIGDDKRQTELARAFLAQRTADDPAFVSALVIAEVVWGLDKVYEVPRQNIHEMLVLVIGSANVHIEREALVAEALRLARDKNTDIADSLIAALARGAGCNVTMTFDKPAAKRVPGMELLS